MNEQMWPIAAGPLLATTQSSGVKVRYETGCELPSCYQVSSLNENKAKSLCRKYPSGVIKYPFYVDFRVFLVS